MAPKYLMEFVAISLYALFAGITFCDGFKLHVARKLLWFGVFLGASLYVLNTRNDLDLSLILPIPTLLAIFLCGYEKRMAAKRRSENKSATNP